MTDILTVKDVSFSYGDKAVLNRVSLEVPKGEIFSILGPSGVGKSTLFNLIAGILPLQEGKIEVDHSPITFGKVSYMLQKDLLLEHKTVLGNILLPLQLKKIPKEEATQTAMKLLEEFKLSSVADHYPNALSGGMRQRIALLRTYLLGHSVFLLDEAFSALDELTRQDLYEWYLESKERLGLTTLVITHSVEEALTLSDRIYILNNCPGEIVANIPLEWDGETYKDWQKMQYKKKILELLADFH